MVTGVTLSLAATLVTGTVLGLVVLLISRRWMTLATALAPLVALLAMAAGVWMGAQQMVIDEKKLSELWLIMLSSVPVALLVGVVLAVQLRRIDRQRAAQQLAAKREAELAETRSQLISWVSHDLRTPLAGIRAMTEAVLDGVATDPQGYLKRILSETDRTSRMVDDVLALSSLNARISTKQEPVDMADLVSDTVATVRPTAEPRDLTIDPAVVGDVKITGNTSQLSRAMLNLAMNAVHYSKPGTHVKVEASSSDDDTVTVQVTDGCGGIPSDELPHLFEAGWRGTTSRTPDAAAGAPHGAGLGLAIVQAVAEGHGGHAGAENTADGCRIWFTVAKTPTPAAAPEPAEAAPRRAKTPATAG